MLALPVSRPGGGAVLVKQHVYFLAAFRKQKECNHSPTAGHWQASQLPGDASPRPGCQLCVRRKGGTQVVPDPHPRGKAHAKGL